MSQNCRSITYMMLSAEETLLLPRSGESLTGLLYLCAGQAALDSDSASPVSLKAGETAIYPTRTLHSLTARTDAAVLLCVFPGEPEAELRLLELRPSLLEKPAQMMRYAYEMLPPGGPPERSAPETRSIPRYIQSAHRLLTECYGEDLTLEELSARVGRSKYHLSRAFRDCYHITPGAYLTSVRLARAEELLTETNLPVREIGRQVGLPNSAYFAALFKRRFGCSPMEYRTIHRNTIQEAQKGAKT